MIGTVVTILAQSDIEEITGAIGDGRDGWDWVTAAAVFVSAIVLGRLARMVVRRLVDRSRADTFLGDLIGRIVSYVIVAIGLVYALESLNIAVAPILGALGIAGIAIAFALQDILENFVAGVMIQLRRPFTAGDEIQSGDHEGTVTAVDARTVTIRTPDGETVRLPSAEVIKQAIVNHTTNGRRRTTIDVGVAYDTDLALATHVARQAAESVPSVLEHPAPEVLVHTFGESSIDLAVRYWHQPSIADMWRARNDVAQAVSRAFDEHGITIPFPQHVLHRAPSPSTD